MKLYFRADTRPPEAIFSEGFKPRSPMAALEKKQPSWNQRLGGCMDYPH